MGDGVSWVRPLAQAAATLRAIRGGAKRPRKGGAALPSPPHLALQRETFAFNPMPLILDNNAVTICGPAVMFGDTRCGWPG